MALLHSRKIKVLVVEDDVVDRDVIKKQLTDTPIMIAGLCSVITLEQALTALSREEYDVVLLDLNLPDSSGLETLSRVHAQFSDLAIIVVTGEGDDKLGLEAVSQGAQDYLVKGEFGRQDLTKSLCNAYERKRTLEAMYREKGDTEAAKRKLEEENQGLQARISDLQGHLDRRLGQTPQRQDKVPKGKGGAVVQQSSEPLIEMTGESPIDLGSPSLGSFSDQTVRELVATFLAESQSLLACLGNAARRQDNSAVKSWARQLGGLAQSVAAQALAHELRQCGRAARAEDSGAVTGHVENVEKEMDRVITLFSDADWIERLRSVRGGHCSQVHASSEK